MKSILLIITIALSTMVFAQDKNAKVDYPTNYREWTHLKSMIINKSHPLANPFEGIHHVYANEKALDGLKKNKYKNGSRFVFDLLQANRDADATTEGKRKFIGVMQYNTQLFKNTGNWGFEAFAGDSKTKRAVQDKGVSCFECHIGVKDSSYVFSNFRK